MTATIPAGPSRLIDLAYRAFESEGYAAQTEVRENVNAGLRLHVTPRHTTPTGTVQLEGQVLGDIPTSGIVVEVLVYYHRQWQPIRTPRTRADERLRINYRFDNATGQFPFRLRVRYGQTGFPYAEARSSWIEATARIPLRGVTCRVPDTDRRRAPEDRGSSHFVAFQRTDQCVRVKRRRVWVAHGASP